MTVFETFESVPEEVKALQWDGSELCWTKLAAATAPGSFIRRATAQAGGFIAYIRTRSKDKAWTNIGPDWQSLNPDECWRALHPGEWIVQRNRHYEIMSDEKFKRRFQKPIVRMVDRWQPSPR